jgi:hypothetical protein
MGPDDPGVLKMLPRPPDWTADIIIWLLKIIIGQERFDRWMNPAFDKGTNDVGPK